MAKELKDFRQGDTKNIRLDYGVGFSIVGYKFWFTLRTAFDDVNPIVQVATTAGNHPLDDVANGIAYLQLESDVSANIPVGKYFWDVQAATPSSPPVVTTLLPTIKNLKDKIEVLEQVTKVVV